MEYSAFIFDFDGVLADSVEVKTRAFEALFKPFGQEVALKVKRHHRDNGGMTRVEKFRHYYDAFLGRPISDGELRDLCDRFSVMVVDQVVASPQIAGAGQFLERWHTKVPCFINSATPDLEIREIVSRRSINQYFKAVCGSDRTKFDNLNHLISEFDLDRRTCLFFGDAQSDYSAAQRGSVSFVGILPDASAPLALRHPDLVWYRDFEELAHAWGTGGGQVWER